MTGMGWLELWLQLRPIKRWLEVRPIKRFREWRQRRRQERQMDKLNLGALLEVFKGFRTSTKAGIAGLVPLLVGYLPFKDVADAYIRQACASDQGPTAFLVGGAVVWLVMFVSARVSKTPAEPGKL